MMRGSPKQRLDALGGVAVMGTDRAAGSSAFGAGTGASAGAGTSAGTGAVNPARQLLDAAAIAGLQARAGRKPVQASGRVAVCPADAKPVASAAQMATLERLLAKPDAGLIEEWAGLARAKGRRVADGAVAGVLGWWAKQPQRSEDVFAVLGTCGAWLASLNSEWRKPVAVADVPPDADELWQTGKAAEREALLRTVRRVDAAGALAMVETTWKADSADERRRFVDVLRVGLSAADEPFLEKALDDKSKLVRAAAAGVLCALPGSALRARMTERARGMIQLEKKGGLLARVMGGKVKIVLALPTELEKAWERDGVEDVAVAGIGKRAWWMVQVVRAADLRVWTEVTGLDPAGVLAAIAGDDYFSQALQAITEAAETTADEVWIRALVARVLAGKARGVGLFGEVWRGLPQAKREALLLEIASDKRYSTLERWMLLSTVGARWSAAYSVKALRLIASHAAASDTAGRMSADWQLPHLIGDAAMQVAPEAAEEFVRVVMAMYGESPPGGINKSMDQARLRAEMHKEFEA